MRVDYDLILLDVMLPDEDGFQVLSRLRSRISTPVIIMTARDDDVDMIVGLEKGADDYLSARPEGFLQKVDTDGSVFISQSELKSLAEEMKSNTGTSIDTSDEAFNTYDIDSDGVLSQDEFRGVMDKYVLRRQKRPPMTRPRQLRLARRTRFQY